MNKPFFSIVTPTYNREEHLAQMITGVLDQDFEDWELIVVDDGGTDHTGELMKYYCQDPRIRYYKRKKNMGIGYTRNEGNSHVRGKWICVCDSDDIWMPGRLKLTYDYIKENPEVDFVYGGMLSGSTEGNYIREYWKPTRVTRKKLLEGEQEVIHGACAYKKWIADEIGYRDEQRMNDDFWFVVDCWNNDVKFGFINKPLMVYRILDDGVSLANFKKIRREMKRKLKHEEIKRRR